MSSTTSSASSATIQYVADVSDAAAAYPKFRMTHASARASAEIYLHGATVCSWRLLDQELLFVSDKATLVPGKAIRGGIPVVFPQFGPGPLPQHGFARNKMWTHGDTTVNKATGDVSTVFTLVDDDETRAVWPFRFELELTVVLKATSLSQQLVVRNRDERAFSFTTLLHTYFAVPHVRHTQVSGLKGLTYIDKVRNMEKYVEGDDAISFTSEVDRVYIDGGSRAVLIRDGGSCDLLVKTAGFRDFVVWNPSEKAATMGDLGLHNFAKFVCVEAGSVAAPVQLDAGATWTGTQGFSLSMPPATSSLVAEKIAAASAL